MVLHHAQSKVAVDPSWRTILEHAAVEVFEMMAGARLEAASATEDGERGELTAMVGLAGALCGMVTIRCSRAVSHQLASQMLGGEAASHPATARDALGELCNTVAGNFKAKISGLADRCMLSVPTVISGSDYTMETVEPTAAVAVVFTYENDPVRVSLVTHA
jgi:chemotaxis protein CheX